MAKVIGPNFGNELEAAGVGGLPFTWGDDGTLYGLENLTPEDQQTVQAVYAAHNPDTLPPVVVPAPPPSGSQCPTCGQQVP